MRIAVVGAGVVGLSTAASLLRSGADVTCYERAGVVLGERSAGSTRIFRLAHVAPELVRFAATARDGYADWAARSGTAMIDPCGCVLSGIDLDDRARAMTAAGVTYELVTGGGAGLRVPAADPPSPALVDPGGGIVDVDAVRAFLLAEAGHVVTHEPVHALEAGAGSVTLRTGGGAHRADAVVVAAGADTPALAAPAGIDLPTALEHHVRFTFGLDDGPARPAWIDHPADGLVTYQHRSGPGRWSVGGTVSAELVAWERDRDAATAASRQVVLDHARERLTVEPTILESLYCTRAPDTGDGVTFRRSGPVLAVHGENLMKFAPALGDVLAGAAMDGSTPADM